MVRRRPRHRPPARAPRTTRCSTAATALDGGCATGCSRRATRRTRSTARPRSIEAWTTLAEHVHDCALEDGEPEDGCAFATALWRVRTAAPDAKCRADAFRVFRVRSTGPDSSGLDGVRIGGIELYGIALFEVSARDGRHLGVPAAAAAAAVLGCAAPLADGASAGSARRLRRPEPSSTCRAQPASLSVKTERFERAELARAQAELENSQSELENSQASLSLFRRLRKEAAAATGVHGLFSGKESGEGSADDAQEQEILRKARAEDNLILEWQTGILNAAAAHWSRLARANDAARLLAFAAGYSEAAPDATLDATLGRGGAERARCDEAARAARRNAAAL